VRPCGSIDSTDIPEESTAYIIREEGAPTIRHLWLRCWKSLAQRRAI